ncbi:MAG TPA: NADH-quinone oxidoreductase subunit C [Stellaceae bacterium]|nr:NADH-quinone oxidoreductase subunit C [Stellaceae bacterium]
MSGASMDNGSDLRRFFSGCEATPQQPWPRYRLAETQWLDLATHLTIVDWALLGLWGDREEVHAALLNEASGEIAVASLRCSERRFPSLASVRPGALRLERAISDLCGLEAAGSEDARPWLDHGQWPRRHPLAAAPTPPDAPRAPSAYAFLPVLGEGVHQIPVGPVHAGIIEPGHFRFHCNGEAVVRLEQRLGYVHKGTESLMAGKPVVAAAKLAGRISGDSTVATALAFARAVEAASATEVPSRAVWLRALMAELERIANHLGDIGAICNDAAFVFMQSEMTVLRERVLQTADAAFGHRLMMDRVIPGGVAHDLDAANATRLAALVRELRPRLAELMAIYDSKPSLVDRTVATGVVSHDLARRFAAGGFIGRASGRAFDARKRPGYPPYDALDFAVPVLSDGDVHSRLMIRAKEIEASLGLVEQILARLPAGAIVVPLAPRAGEGMALVEGFRGDILAWAALAADGTVRRGHLRDPSWFQWPLLEAAIEGNIVADFPLCNKSFNCSYSGHDL